MKLMTNLRRRSSKVRACGFQTRSGRNEATGILFAVSVCTAGWRCNDGSVVMFRWGSRRMLGVFRAVTLAIS